MTSHELTLTSETLCSNSDTQNELDSRANGELEHDVTSCGVGSCRPRRLEWLANINTFTFVFSASLLPLTVLEVYIGSQISSIEKQFGLNSTTVGVLIGCFEIGFLITALPFGHFGQRSHIPRILSFAAVLGGVSGLLVGACNYIQPISLPVYDVYDVNVSATSSFPDAPLCTFQNDSPIGNTSSDSCSDMTSRGESNHQWVAGLLGLFLALLGVARSPSISLSMAFIDDNVSHPSKTSIYLGIIFTLGVIGPAVALAVGGAVGQIPVDLQETQLQPGHHKWIGAWWLGFFIFGSLSISTALPMFFFPRKLKGRRKKEELRLHTRSVRRVIKELVKSLKNVLCTPVFMLLLAANCSFMFFIEGDAIFASKYVEHQFMIPSYKASLILGMEQLISAAVGNICGGLITYKLKLTRLGCLKLVLISISLSCALYCLEYFLGCENPHIVGMPEDRSNNITSCLCDLSSYYPICGSDRLSYFSPCVAGCEQQTGTNFTDCSLIADGKAVSGLCENGCPYLYYYIATDLLCILVGSMCLTPFGICFMRTVNDCDKSLALALNSFLNSLLGFLPAPILYGMIVDSACGVWNIKCGVVKECALYDIEQLRFRLKGLSSFGQVLGLSLIFAAFVVLRKIDGKLPEVQHHMVEEEEKHEEIKEITALKA